MLPLRIWKCRFSMPSFHLRLAWHERNDGDPAHLWLRGLILKSVRAAQGGQARGRPNSLYQDQRISSTRTNVSRLDAQLLQSGGTVMLQRSGIRFGWLFLSLTLLAGAGYFLYPSFEGLTETEVEPAVAHVPPQPAASVVERQPVKSKKKPNPATPRTTALAAPEREIEPLVPEGIGNRIDGMIPITVTVRIGRDGRVQSAHSTQQPDGLHAYLAQQAIEAAKLWRFRPARAGAELIATQQTIHFRFYRSGVKWD
jgi:TonB family protein